MDVYCNFCDCFSCPYKIKKKGFSLMNNAVLEFNNVSKRYKNRIVLNNINLSFEAGKIYGLVGGNGAGKTTLIRMAAGLTFPSTGRISILGHSHEKDFSQQRKKIGFLIENPALYYGMTAKQNLIVQQLLKNHRDDNEIDFLLKKQV